MPARYMTEETEDKYSSILQMQNLGLDVSFVIGAEVANAINVALTFKEDKSQNALAVRANVRMYLSDDAAGAGIVAVAPSGAVAIGTNGIIADIGGGTKKVFMLGTNAAGLVDVTINEAGAKTLYMIVVMPNGRIVASGAIAFA